MSPRGAIVDNSNNYRFNLKLYAMLDFCEDISLLDLGCAGGGLVRSILEDGYTAIGLEGSDASKRARSGEWDTIPYHLFTCDIAKPFQISMSDGTPVLCDVVTAWEVFEHIPQRDLGTLLENIFRYLKPGGYLICSIDMLPDGHPLTGAVYHHTLQPKEGWEDLFRERGLYPASDHCFETSDMVRGNGLSLKDWHPDDGGGFHLVLRKKPSKGTGRFS